jgi:hypothetical protein
MARLHTLRLHCRMHSISSVMDIVVRETQISLASDRAMALMYARMRDLRVRKWRCRTLRNQLPCGVELQGSSFLQLGEAHLG